MSGDPVSAAAVAALVAFLASRTAKLMFGQKAAAATSVVAFVSIFLLGWWAGVDFFRS